MEYGNVVWHPHLKKDIRLLESVNHPPLEGTGMAWYSRV